MMKTNRNTAVDAAAARQHKRHDGGFLLIEVMVAILVLSVGVLAQLSMQVKSIHSNASALRMTQRTVLGADRIEKLMGLPYDHESLEPGTYTAEEGKMTIAWEVSEPGTPIDNVKTITVTTSFTESGNVRSETHVYYKADKI